MSEDNLKWSEYDFTKTPYDDLVRVGLYPALPL